MGRRKLATDQDQTVFIVDDDRGMRKSLSWLVESVGLNVETFESARQFLDSKAYERSGCLVLDVRMPGMSGVELQNQLVNQGVDMPTIIVTGFGDVPTAVRAMKNGAVDFIQKPFSDQMLLDRITQCLVQDAERRREHSERIEIQKRLASLSPREREVMDLILTGKTTREIAENLSLSPRTVDIHRAKVMRKMQVRSAVQLAQLAGGAGAQ